MAPHLIDDDRALLENPHNYALDAEVAIDDTAPSRAGPRVRPGWP